MKRFSIGGRFSDVFSDYRVKKEAGVAITWEAQVAVDENFGADIDGNRGARDVDIHQVHFAIYRDGEDITGEVKELPGEFSRIVGNLETVLQRRIEGELDEYS
jgi:hypothetical protein